MIKVKHLKKEYPNAVPLKDVSVEIHDGDVIAVIGPSGTGKSTLIRCLNLLEMPTSGEIWIGDDCLTDGSCDIANVRRRMGMVFQNYNLFSHLNVIENCMIAPMDLLGRTKQQAYDDGMRLLRSVGLSDRAMNYPDALSGGQKQRAAIARTLAMEPEIILFDEPTSALDPTMVGEVQAVIRDLAAKGMTMLIVTHDMRFARDIANRVFYMDEGGIYEDGTPEQIFDHPQREKTAHFIRRIKACEHVITSADFDFIGFSTDLETFGQRNRISSRTVYRMHAVFEELCVQILLPRLKTDFAIRLKIEFSQEDESVSMRFSYSGAPFDPRDSDNALSVKLLDFAAEFLDYRVIAEEPYTNDLLLKIR